MSEWKTNNKKGEGGFRFGNNEKPTSVDELLGSIYDWRGAGDGCLRGLAV